MSDKIYWVAVDGTPTSDELREIGDTLGENFDHKLIVSTKEIEPMDKAEIMELLAFDERADE